MSREYFKGEREEQRAYSRAVKVRGGTTVYLAGIGAPVDAQGHSLAGNFAAQTHQVFAHLRETMALVGGTLDDIVTMTVFITDPRYGDEFVEIRKQYFTRGFPGSALISVYALARPAMMVEVQAIAVLDTRGHASQEEGRRYNGIAPFLTVCRASTVAEALCLSAPLSSPCHEKRRTSWRRLPLLRDQHRPSTNAETLSDGMCYAREDNSHGKQGLAVYP